VRPGLILLDLNMPGVDGRQVLERLKASPTLRPIPVIILTTSSDTRDIEQCYALGASTFIQKPVDFDGLAAAVRAMRDYWFGIALLPEALA
jgi:CheY-like chemotaxis protein